METFSTLTEPVILGGAAAALSVLLLLAFRHLKLVEWITSGVTRSVKCAEKSKRDDLEGEIADPDPLPALDLSDATTRDHLIVNKCIRWPYFQTMAHKPMHINNWIEIDFKYKEEMRYKASVIAEHPERTVLSLPENDEACGELLQTLVDYLPKRYPTLFESLPNGGIINRVLDLRFEECSALRGVEALHVVAKLVQDDFLMGREREDGHVYFVGGLVAIPGFYDFRAKLGMSMASVHAPVPHFNEKILMSVERTLKRFKPNEPFERSSWEIVDDLNSYQHNIAKLAEGERVREDLHPKDLILRIDHQTFRKLPKTRAIIFGVHPILRPIHTLADLPLVPALLATVHKEGNDDLMKYKLAPCCCVFFHEGPGVDPATHIMSPADQDKLLPYLAEMTQSQIDRGLIRGDEDVANFRDLVKKAQT